MAGVALFFDDAYLKHDTGAHPENPRRVEHTYAHLRSTHALDRLSLQKPRAATDDEIMLVHRREYVEHLRSLPSGEMTALDPDTLFGPGSLDAAVRAAGAITAAIDDIGGGRYDRAFCLVRPPGHHALPARAMGFCILNNIAIGAAYANRVVGMGRIAIIDIDVHHGNGTQEIFYEDGEILYCSIHEWPFYPGTGSTTETGRGAGKGKTVNVPLPHGSPEEAYVEALKDKILPAVKDHSPSIIMISAGFDAHRADHIGGMRLETDSYRRLTRLIAETADQTCQGRVISALEGGYNLEALAASVEAHLEAMLD